MSRSRDLGREKHLRYLKDRGLAGYVPAGPVQERIRYLHDKRGIIFDTIAERVGLNVETIKMQYRGTDKNHKVIQSCEYATQKAILGARFAPEDCTYYPALGIRRRLQALHYAGFTGPFLAARLPVATYRALHLTTTGKKSVFMVGAGFARAVIDLHDQLIKTNPEAAGINFQSASRCRTYAVRAGYVPHTCWDPYTYDDPDALPEWTGRCGTVLGTRIHRRENIPMCEACSTFDFDPRLPGFQGDRFRALREKRGVSRREMAEAVGMNESGIVFWEQGRSVPARQFKIDAALSYLDATFEDVYDMEDPGWEALKVRPKRRSRRRAVLPADSTSPAPKR